MAEEAASQGDARHGSPELASQTRSSGGDAGEVQHLRAPRLSAYWVFCSVLHDEAKPDYERKPDYESEVLTARLVELAHEPRRFSYRRLHALMKRDGIHANHKCMPRLYREAALAVRRRRRHYGAVNEREQLTLPSGTNEVGSINFVMDALSNGRRLKCGQHRRFLQGGRRYRRKPRHLERVCCSSVGRAACFRDCPKALSTDQGLELTNQVLDRWVYVNSVTLKLIQPGKPTKNAHIESFNGKFRDECLNEPGSTMLAHARAIAAAWRQDYNKKSLHSALNYLLPGKVSGPLWLFLYDLLV